MPISGLVITLSEDTDLAAQALEALKQRAELTLGTPHNRWLPLVLEAPDPRTGSQLHEWLCALPGVATVDVVTVHFDEDKT